MNSKLALISIIVSLNCSVAYANHDGAHEGCKDMKNMDFSMKDMDTNKDGDISRDEYAASTQGDIDKNFKHLDANNDGKLDAKEQKDVENVLKEMHSPNAKTKTKAPVNTM